MREIDCKEITAVIAKLCYDANYNLPKDVKKTIEESYDEEEYPLAKENLKNIIENFKIAEEESIPICQDTGMACIWVEIGQDVHVTGGNLENAINEGVRQGYEQGFLRKSIVEDPVFGRKNTKTNTPAAITYKIVDGENIRIIVAPKGFGSENMCKIKMLKPSEGIEGIKEFVLETVKAAGPNACPPFVIGVGIGGNFDKVALLSKEAMILPLGTIPEKEEYAKLQKELLEEINKTGIGPAGLGGGRTVLGLNIKTMPTHIAGMPAAVSICCHVARHKEAIL